MNSPAETAAEMRAEFVHYEIWYVPRATDGGSTWCARRYGAPARTEHTLYAGSATELAEKIEAEVTG